MMFIICHHPPRHITGGVSCGLEYLHKILQSANEVLGFSKSHKLRKTPKMLSIMAEAYLGKGDLQKGDNFLQKINCYTSDTYVVVLKYKLINAEHAEMIINEMKMKKIELSKEHYQGMIYGYARVGMVAKAKQVIIPLVYSKTGFASKPKTRPIDLS